MRPIIKPRLPDAWFAIPPSDLLLQSFGEYCLVSEQPLPSNHFVWHKRLGIEISAPASRTHWQDLLLLSENSFLAQLGRPVPRLLFPDETLTYSLDGKGPFRYELQRVMIIVQDENGDEIRREKSEEVIISGTNEVAEATIEFFALNTQFFNAKDAIFFIPNRAVLSGFDRRVQQRTAVWIIASDFAGTWLRSMDTKSNNKEVMESFIAQGRRLAAATGYWSRRGHLRSRTIRFPFPTFETYCSASLFPGRLDLGPTIRIPEPTQMSCHSPNAHHSLGRTATPRTFESITVAR